jgi:hypothetical protein
MRPRCRAKRSVLAPKYETIALDADTNISSTSRALVAEVGRP